MVKDIIKRLTCVAGNEALQAVEDHVKLSEERVNHFSEQCAAYEWYAATVPTQWDKISAWVIFQVMGYDSGSLCCWLHVSWVVVIV